MNSKQILEQWQALSQKVLACILVDPGAVFPVMQVIDTNAHWFPPRDRPIWQAVMSCLDEMIPPTPEAVISRLGDRATPEYVRHVVGQFDDTANSLIIYNAEQLRDIGILAHFRQLSKQFYDEATTVEAVREAITKAQAEFSGILATRSNRNAGAVSVGAKAWGLVESFDGQGIPMGLKWFDEMAGGLWPGMNYWIAAAYKSGKTTLMRNCILATAQAGHPAAAYCAENSREMFALACQAMLATQHLLDNGTPRDRCRLSAIFILMNWNRNRAAFSRGEQVAIEWAREYWNTLPIRVYDASDSISDMTTLQYLIKRDRIEYGTQVVWADYSQLFGGSRGTLFERQSAVALRVQEIAAKEKVAFCMLAQRNETGVQSGDGGYSANIKGGGDASAAADFLFMPAIDPDTPTVMEVKLKYSRHTRAGQTHHHLFNPSSGLILGEVQAQVSNFAGVQL